ncbi:MAG: DegT/DnrJ/EryC1/StrS family aminotransferase, partial [Anaerolineae bacterium]
LAGRYDAGLAETGGLSRPEATPRAEQVYHQYVVRTPLRDALRDYLAGAGVSTSVHYPCGVHLQPAFAYLGYEPGSCPVAEKLAAEVLSLPIFAQLTAAEAQQVIRLVRFFFAMH